MVLHSWEPMIRITMCSSSITMIPTSDRRPSSSNLFIKEFAFSIVQTATEVSLGSVPPPWLP
jgi:hypothetical protein